MQQNKLLDRLGNDNVFQFQVFQFSCRMKTSHTIKSNGCGIFPLPLF